MIVKKVKWGNKEKKNVQTLNMFYSFPVLKIEKF